MLLSDIDIQKLCLIQSACRNKLASELVKRFMDPAKEITNGMDFPNLVDFLRNKALINNTEALLKKVLGAQTIKTKVFLASYMVKYFSTDVFPEMDDQLVKSVREAADAMHNEFNTVLETIKQCGTQQDCERLVALAIRYKEVFEAWRGPDSLKAADRLGQGIMALHNAKNALRHPNIEQAAIQTYGDIDEVTASLDARIADLRLKLEQLREGGNSRATEILDSLDAAQRIQSGLALPM